MPRVWLALAWHELSERARDRWVLLISFVFAGLASAVTMYSRSADGGAAQLTGPSLVTLASLLIPLIALVLGHDAIVGERERNTLGLLFSLPIGRTGVVVAKYTGRLLALTFSITLGFGLAALAASEQHRGVLSQLWWPSLLLGSAFLSLGMLISSISMRQVTAVSTVIFAWFVLVFFYDLGLLALLVGADGRVSSLTIERLVAANPAGLFRVEMMSRFTAKSTLVDLGIREQSLSRMAPLIWGLWIVMPVACSGIFLWGKKSV